MPRSTSSMRARVCCGTTEMDGVFRLELDDGQSAHAHRVVLATGIRDVFPPVDNFEAYFGRSIFTCPSCDGYEAQGKAVVVVGDSPEMAEFAVGLLDWAGSVIAVRANHSSWSFGDRATAQLPLDDVAGRVVAIAGSNGQVRSLEFDDGRSLACDLVFWSMRHEQQSDLAIKLGCAMSEDGCVMVDCEGATSVQWVYAAGDMTPGAHLIQVAAAKGATAGIAAANVAARACRFADVAPSCANGRWAHRLGRAIRRPGGTRTRRRRMRPMMRGHPARTGSARRTDRVAGGDWRCHGPRRGSRFGRVARPGHMGTVELWNRSRGATLRTSPALVGRARELIAAALISSRRNEFVPASGIRV